MLRRARPLLGTFVEITASAAHPAVEQRACDAAFEAIADVHRLMSFHERGSDVSRLNRAAHRRAIEVDPRTATVLQRALEIGRLSRGAFDCTVGARMVALGLLPGSAATSRRAGGFRDILLSAAGSVRFRRPLAIDLGGIAKGFAVDQAVAALARAGADAGCVNAGGDLRVFGERVWPIEIRRPDAPARCVPLPPLRDRAIATSADSFAAGGHLLDPATGRLHRRGVSVSVIAPSCMDADALTKVVWLAKRIPHALLEKTDARAILLGRLEDSSEPTAGALRAAGQTAALRGPGALRLRGTRGPGRHGIRLARLPLPAVGAR